MYCPKCGQRCESIKTTANWNKKKKPFRRKRKCEPCNLQFYTYELNQVEYGYFQKMVETVRLLSATIMDQLGGMMNMKGLLDEIVSEREEAMKPEAQKKQKRRERYERSKAKKAGENS